MECASKAKLNWWFMAGSLAAVLATYLINSHTPYHFLGGAIGGGLLALSGQLFLMPGGSKSVPRVAGLTVVAAVATGAVFAGLFRILS